MYIPQAQVPDPVNALNVSIGPMAWVVRTSGEPYQLSSAIQEQIRQASGLPATNVRTMDEVVTRSTSRQRFNMWLMSVFGGCALLLAAIGIYGLMAYSVEQRTQEIGIRLALGASVQQVRNMVVRQGMLLALVGVVLGVASAFGLARLVQTMLYGVTTRDPLVFAGVPVVLTAVAFLAVYLPARQASRVDPVTALRYGSCRFAGSRLRRCRFGALRLQETAVRRLLWRLVGSARPNGRTLARAARPRRAANLNLQQPKSRDSTRSCCHSFHGLSRHAGAVMQRQLSAAVDRRHLPGRRQGG
jgi:predicted lysophospholipase L1 biosynthesis ABC-type transport system permease subunit